jgi:myo-inositol-1(or 4)-monophosphatase
VDDGRTDLNHARRVAVDVATEAGALLRVRGRGKLGAQSKGHSGDVVTELDLAAEDLVLRRLRATFPDHRIVAEESGVHGSHSAWTWLVDPLDGTNNVAIGLPAYVIGLALCFEGRPVVGVVHDPVTDQTWSAVRGAGACGPDGPLRPAHRPTPYGPVLGWTQGHGVSRSDDTARALKLVLERHAYRLLQLWAPLLCWVMLARGDIDGFVGYHAEAVDLPAGSLVAEEAGLVIRALDGGPFEDRVAENAERSFVAGHQDRIPELLELVRAAEGIRPAVRALALARTDRLVRPELSRSRPARPR